MSLTPVQQITLAAQKSQDAADILQAIVEGDEFTEVNTVGGRTHPSIAKWFSDQFIEVQNYITQEADRSSERADFAADRANFSDQRATESEGFRNEALAFRNTAESHRDTANQHRIDSEASKDAAKVSEDNSKASENASKASETECQRIEDLLSRTASFEGEWNPADGDPSNPAHATDFYYINADGTIDGKSVLAGDLIHWDRNTSSWTAFSTSGRYTRNDIDQQIGYNWRFNNNKELRFGDSNSLKLYHTGTNSFLTNSNGVLYVSSFVNSGNIIFRSRDGVGTQAETLTINYDATTFRAGGTKVLTLQNGDSVLDYNLDVKGVIKLDGEDIDSRYVRVGSSSSTTGEMYISNNDAAKPTIWAKNNAGGTVAEFHSNNTLVGSGYNDGWYTPKLYLLSDKSSHVSQNGTHISFVNGSTGDFNFDATVRSTGSFYADGSLVHDSKTNAEIQKYQPRLLLRCPQSGETYTEQSAIMEIGETSAASVKIVYTGDGKGYIGMGAYSLGGTNSNTMSGAGVVPQYSVMRMDYTSNDVDFFGEVRAVGEVIAFYSDQRLKDEVGKIDNAMGIVNKWRGVYYTANSKGVELAGADKDKVEVGLYAQDIKATVPAAVEPAPFDHNGDGKSISGENYMTVKYNRLVPVIATALQEKDEEIQVLKKQRVADKDKIDELAKQVEFLTQKVMELTK